MACGIAALSFTALAVPAQAADGPPAKSDTWVQEPKATQGTLSTARMKALVTTAPAPGSSADPSAFNLAAGSDLSGRVSDLDAALPKQGVQNLLSQANRTLSTDTQCPDTFGTGDNGTPLAPVKRYCFEHDDEVSTEWVPQAVTGVSDAQDDEYWGTARPVLTGWYDNENPGRSDGCTASESDACNEKGVRVTFVDPSTNKYRHVLLVWPYYNSYGHISYDALHADDTTLQNGIHAGGMAWYGNYLYVADTMNGLRVFDMSKIMDLNPDQDASKDDATPDGLTSNVSDTKQIGRQNNVWYGYGYRYVMPQVATWTFSSLQYNSPDTDTCSTTGAPKASYVSIDRSTTPDELVVGEYCNSDTNFPNTGRIGAWQLNGSTGQLASSGGIASGVNKAYYLPQDLNQGAARYNGTWYFNQSHLYKNGTLIRARVGTDGKLAAFGNGIPTAVGPEDLYYEHGQATGNPPLLWSVSEHSSATNDPSCSIGPSPCARLLYAHNVNTILAQP
ncbi:hypothetical protein [Streptomyces sp. NPDC005573]|uniref:hypothetical protein n=1 Tax=Streptomyces sp. NPDC005573 TaxID=3156890 RepID=UPI0033BC5A5B